MRIRSVPYIDVAAIASVAFAAGWTLHEASTNRAWDEYWMVRLWVMAAMYVVASGLIAVDNRRDKNKS